MAKFDLNDDSVVVVIGSGAGGGTLGTDLAIAGVKTVILEAGKRTEFTDFVNDEWESFGQLAWADQRMTSGSWRVSQDFGQLPARQHTGPVHRFASKIMSLKQKQFTAMFLVPHCSTGRSH